MIKILTGILLFTVITAGLAGCGSDKTDDETSQSDKIKVSVSFDAMKEFVQAVGKDRTEISVIVPAGTEPHDFEPKAKDLAALGEAHIFVYNGLGMEPWAEKAISSAGNGSLLAVDTSEGADIVMDLDPHLWLSLKGAAVQAERVKDALIQTDPDNKEYYEQNYSGFAADLDSLFNEYSEKFKAVSKKSFVTGHAAFGYLCRDFGLEMNSVESTFAEGEPTPKQLGELVEYCKANNVTAIFAEEAASPRVSKTLADEVGAKVETIYTIESADGDNMTYIQRMEYNLSKIYDSLL